MSLLSRIFGKRTVDAKMQSRALAFASVSLNLLRAARNTGSSNRLVSPYSILQALGMLSLGASGETLEELMGALCWTEKPAQLHSYLSSLQQRLQNVSVSDGSPTLRAANRIWLDSSMQMSQQYLSEQTRYYAGGVATVPFLHHAEEAAEVINEWVTRMTAGEIPKVVDHMDIAGALVVLTNALYLDARWEVPFDAKYTERDTFRRPEGDVKVSFMEATHLHRCFHRPGPDELDVVELPYRDSDLSLTLLVPRKQPLRGFVDALSASQLDGLLDAVESERIQLHVPRFKFDVKLQLQDALEHLGVHRAFTDDAQLERMGRSSQGPAQIGTVIHKARIRVNEGGTVAAAFTTTALCDTIGLCLVPDPPPPRVVKIDQPFLFLIRDLQTGTLLFLGEVDDPTCSARSDASRPDFDREGPKPDRILYSLDELVRPDDYDMWL